MSTTFDHSTETEFKNAAWYYTTPSEKAKNIKDYVAFCQLLHPQGFWTLFHGVLILQLVDKNVVTVTTE